MDVRGDFLGPPHCTLTDFFKDTQNWSWNNEMFVRNRPKSCINYAPLICTCFLNKFLSVFSIVIFHHFSF